MKITESLGINIGLLDVLQSPNVSTIYLSGSQYDGFGHRDSDIDVFVVRSSEDAGIKDIRGREIELEYFDDKRIDIEHWDVKKVRSLIETLHEFRKNEMSPHAVPYLSISQKNFLHRLCIGESIYNQDEFLHFRNLIDRSSLSHINFWDFNSQYIGHQEDTVGLMAIGDYEGALIACQSTVEAAIDALTSSMGDTNLPPKWRFKRLVRNNLDDVRNMYLGFFRESAQYFDNPPTFLEKYIQEANSLLYRVNF